MRLLRIIWLLLVFLLRVARALLRLALTALGFLALLLLLNRSTYPTGNLWNQVALTIAEVHFDYVGWELNALSVKFDQTLFGMHPFMDEAARAQYVRDYTADLTRARQLEAEIDRAYADPAVSDPAAVTAEQRAERDARRADLRQRQPLYESILEGQVAAVLQDLGFGTAGQILPPVSAHFTQTPYLLVVSPRDTIRLDIYFNLDPLPVDARERLEAQIDSAYGVSALIVPIGGIALYPAMILETTSIPFALETVAHEWLHHYLFAFPLGLNYDFSGETRIINETTASLFGEQVARLALTRYYPDLLPPEPPQDAAPPPDAPPPPHPFFDPQPFDFGREMHYTRKRVDWLLGQGRIDEAEGYMEERRQFFASNGYIIRKINQAFFAFYGGYQVGGTPGIGGADPIGPAVQDIYDFSGGLHEFVIAMRGITTRAELVAARDGMAQPDAP